MKKSSLMKMIAVVGLLMFIFTAAGCAGLMYGEKTITVKDGVKTTKIKSNKAVAAEQAVKEMEAKAKLIKAASELDSYAQNAMMARGDWNNDLMASFSKAERAKYAAFERIVKSVGNNSVTGYLGGKAFDFAKALSANSGDTYNTRARDISSTATGGGEGSGSVTSSLNLSGQQAGGDMIRGSNNIPYYLRGSTVNQADKLNAGDGEFNNPVTVKDNKNGLVPL